MENNANIDFLKNIFSSSGDEIFLCDKEGNIKYKNKIANENYPKIKNLNKLAHLFNFEICILKSEDLLTYNPISSALKAGEAFYANITKQINDSLYVEYSLSAILLEENLKLIIFRNDFNKEILDKYKKAEEKNTNLENQIIYTSELKAKLENQLLRTNLINFVSDKVREFISTKKIIKIILEQLRKTLDISKAEFSYDIKSKEMKIQSEFDEKTLISKLFVPVFSEKKIYGYIILYRKNQQNSWQKEEVALVKNIASLLGTTFSKEELYEKLEMQKNELEKALEQLKNAQLQIVQSEKMVTLGQLVAGVAHEINTPLGAISSNINLLEKISSKNTDVITEILQETTPVTKEAIRRIEKLINSLKNFTRLDEAKKKKVNIEEGILSTLDLLEHETKNKVKIITDFDKIPLVSCYPDYINQVFMNVILNACQSVKDNGEVKIKTFQKDNYAIITIQDNGKGIKKEYLSKIFDFGFTTKKIGEGTGLGLALAKKIIDEHKGKILVESSENNGTIFEIHLPLE